MQEFEGRVAVVTGAASGIGLATASRLASEGMRLVLADIEREALDEAVAELADGGHEVIGVPTDVSRWDAVEALAEKAMATYGQVNVVHNNAGVVRAGRLDELTLADWEWVLGVNVFGCIHGARTFLPILIEQGEPGWMVNTASIGGVLTGPFLAPYIVSKHAVVALSEVIHHELAAKQVDVGISCLCPGAVATGIFRSERIRPDDKGEAAPLGSEPEKAFFEGMAAGIDAGMEPEELARHAFEGVREGRFWIFPDSMYREGFEARAQSILSGVNPLQSPITSD